MAFYIHHDARQDHRKYDKNDLSLKSVDIRRAMHDEEDSQPLMSKVDKGEELTHEESVHYRKIYRRVYARRYRQVNKDNLRTYHREYVRNNPNRLNEQQKRYRKRHPKRYQDYQRNYRNTDM